jgi:hypothetical protein
VTITFTRTRNQLADLVLGKLGAKANGVSADSADMEIIYEALDLRLKEIHKYGIFWRKVDETPLSFSLTANTNSASATVDILFPIQMTVTDGSLDMPVAIIGAREYAAIENKADTGRPTRVLWKGSAEFLFHPVPTAAATAKLIYEKFADDTANATAPDVDASMLRSLKDIVAYDCGDHWGTPEAKLARWRTDAAMAERDIRRLAVEHKDLEAVAVDDWDGRPALSRRRTDYGY